MWSEWWNRFLASDPALRRLRTAARVSASVAITIAIMIPLFRWWGLPPASAMAGAVVAINSSLAVNDATERDRKITTLLMPLPTAASLLMASLTTQVPLLSSLLFLAVIFTATYIRRFGSRYYALGMVGFMGYFFAMFLHPAPSAVPYMAVAVVCGALAAFVLRFLVLRDNPEGILARGRHSLRAQVHGLLHALRDVAEHPESRQRRRQLHNRSVRLNETSLMLENTVQQLDSLDESGRAELRQRILDVELAAENLLNQLLRIIDHPSSAATVPKALTALLAVLRSDPDRVRDATRAVADRVEQRDSPEIAMAIRRLGTGLAELASASGELGGEPVAHEDTGTEPAKLDEETGVRRPEFRTAVQAGCAAAIAMVLGQLISPNRWYWAVITAFVVFISANSRGELLVRAWQRTAGTMLGVVAGILVAVQVTGNTTAEILLILLCVFLAFYFAGYSYALMTFFITTMLGVLYGMMGTFNVGVLATRLVETAAGALAGVLASSFVLPTRTRSLVRDNMQDFLLSLRDFLRETGTDTSTGGPLAGLQEQMRDLDDRLHRLLTSARPLTSYRLRAQRSQIDRSVIMTNGCAYYVRNLSVVLPNAVEMVDSDTHQRLAEVLWALAGTVESMTDGTEPGTRPHTAPNPVSDASVRAAFEEANRSLQEHADVLHDIAEALTSEPTSLHRSIKLLDRIGQIIEDLAKEFAFTASSERHSATGTATRT